MKLKEKTKKKIRGSITILLIILMLPSMTLSAIVVDSSRINMARSMVSSSGDLAMNTALANYDTILKDVYGLFAMSQDKTDEQLANELRDYFATTLVSYGVVNEAESGDYVDALIGDFRDIIANSRNGSVSNFLDMNVVDFTATKVDNSSLANANILRSQIVEYMKYRAPLNFGLSFLDSINAFKNVQDQTTVVQSQVAAQESVQDVTDACQKIIASIRDYDKLMESIKTGDKAVKGKANSTDNVTVDIAEYHTQVDKYYSVWGDNYTHANMLNLVFLLKSPSVETLYLKNLDIYNSKWFIKTDNSGLLYDGSGINLSPTLASSTSEAKTQVENQMDKLNNTNNVEKKTATAYEAKDYLSQSYISVGANLFTNETAAINTFIDFEKFLTDDGSLKYSDVKTTLESIYMLGKYYDNYYGKITTDINTAKTAMDNANNAVSTASSNASTYHNRISSNVTSINNANSNYVASYDFLKEILNSDDEDLQVVIANLMAQTTFAMPTSTSYVGNKYFTNFAGYINNFKENSSDLDNQYLKVFKEIINSTLKSNATYKDICTTSTTYLADKASGKTSKTFEDYVKATLGEESLENNLYVLLNHLYTNSGYVDSIKSNISSYDSVKNGYATLVDDANAKTQDYNNKVAQRNTVEANYKNCLSRYNSFVKAYQNDLVFYGKYISAAKSVIESEVSTINVQFTQIKTNVKALIDQLGVIETNLTNAGSAIKTYNEKLATWQSANNTYESQNGSDSFSKQNAADAQTSLNQYNIDSLNTLKAYVVSIKSELQDFYDRITDSTHFKYGSKKIDTITVADHMKSAVSSSVKDSLPTVVTVEAAHSKLSTLYKNEATGSIEMEWYFLNPMLPIQFLKYLNETYPESAPTTSPTVTVGGESMAVGSGKGEFNFETAKNDLKNNSGGTIQDDTNQDTFGYSYQGKSVDKTKVPSGNSGKTGDANTEFNITSEAEDADDIDVSSGFDAQTSALGSILGGIENIATNALENTYVMSYIFNNFSYNTLIQDTVIEKENDAVDGKTPLNAIVAADGLFVTSNETFNNVKDKTTTLSNYAKNKYHNYFYGAEIEYLLYGNGSAEKNVTYTKASIYAIRFAFNCIYAFTNSEIRNSTMSVGLAVQAATLGIVPYQIVQIVLQLALAAAESAVDLNMMNSGLKVAVVKTNDTWSLSISQAVKSAGQMAGDAAVNVATKAISSVSSGLQGLVDAGADELNGSLTDLSENLTDATEGKLEEIVDGAFNIIQSKIEDKLNELQYETYNNVSEATNIINDRFNSLETEIVTELNTYFSGNAVADAVLPYITDEISGLISSVKKDILDEINVVGNIDVGAIICEKMIDIKIKLVTYSSEAIESVKKNFDSITANITSEISGKLNGYISQTEDELTEEAATKIKEEVTQATNDFINEFLDDDVTDAIGGGTSGAGSSSVASMIKFGYKDYLMLFVFISLSVTNDDNPTIARIADMIEVNIQHADTSKGAKYSHKKGTAFNIKDAKTYVSIHAETELDMLFMNMDFFTDILLDDDTDVSGQLTPAATIEYNGLFGY